MNSPDPEQIREAVDRFHVVYYSAGWRGGTWTSTRWLGVPVQKCPLDLWIYQEILFETRPDLIVEAGTAFGGSALFFASMCDLLAHGEVVTIDVMDVPGRPVHPRIRYLRGSSIAPEIVAHVASLASARRVLAVLDSDHHREHVLAELRAYAPLVCPGSYLIVEDTNLNGNPVLPGCEPGPREAVIEFLAQDARFEPDASREKLYLTFNPGGYLRRKA
jgi:cephalosporin hydroxylase